MSCNAVMLKFWIEHQVGSMLNNFGLPCCGFSRSLQMNNVIVQEDVKKATFSLLTRKNILIEMSKRTWLIKCMNALSNNFHASVNDCHNKIDEWHES